MKLLFTMLFFLTAFMVNNANAQAGWCDCYGGVSVDGSYWQLLDNEGKPLEDGDWVYAAWVGPDGEIDPPGFDGYPTDDDILLPLAGMEIEYSTFFITVASWQKGATDQSENLRHPTDGELIYCRIFDGPQDSISTVNYYADSQLHEIAWNMGDVMYCLFPGDPGSGHTDMPVPAEQDSTAQSSSEPCDK